MFPTTRLTLRYKDPQEDEKITADGMLKFLEDLSLNPESQVVLIIAWKFKAATQCEFTRDEFINGMTDVGCDSIDRLKSKVGAPESGDLPRVGSRFHLFLTKRFKDDTQVTQK